MPFADRVGFAAGRTGIGLLGVEGARLGVERRDGAGVVGCETPGVGVEGREVSEVGTEGREAPGAMPEYSEVPEVGREAPGAEPEYSEVPEVGREGPEEEPEYSEGPEEGTEVREGPEGDSASLELSLLQQLLPLCSVVQVSATSELISPLL